MTGWGTAFPGVVTQQALWDGFFADHFSHRRAARIAFESAGVRRRHAAVNPLLEDLSLAPTSVRMERYLAEAMPLGKEALSRALESAKLAPEDVGLLAVVSCTGYATPGIDVRLASDLAMALDLQRINIGHVGCHAALPAIGMARDFAVTRDKPAVVLSLELSSLHVQPATTDLEQAVVHSLFSDAAAAVVVEPIATACTSGLKIVDLIAITDPTAMSDMTWSITDQGFRMTLSRHVSDVVARVVKPLVDDLLRRNGLARDAVDAWAIHPGGPRILDVVRDELLLSEQDIAISRNVLFERGNCSSASVMLVLNELCDGQDLVNGAHVVALVFGPGLTLYAALLEWVDAT